MPDKEFHGREIGLPLEGGDDLSEEEGAPVVVRREGCDEGLGSTETVGAVEAKRSMTAEASSRSFLRRSPATICSIASARGSSSSGGGDVHGGEFFEGLFEVAEGEFADDQGLRQVFEAVVLSAGQNRGGGEGLVKLLDGLGLVHGLF